MKYRTWLPITGVLGLTACVTHTTYPVAKPITPVGHSVWGHDEYRRVDSLQPTFRWKPSSKPLAPDTSYDLIIYEATDHGHQGGKPRWIPGHVAYHREGLKAPEHTLEAPLKAFTLYIWSVRIRQGQTVSAWAGYNSWTVTPVPGLFFFNEKDEPFLFKTLAK